MSSYQLPKGYLSVSQVQMYLKCGIQYYFAYILGIKSPPNIALATGSSGHEALEANFKFKAVDENHQDMPTADVVDAFSTAYDKNIKNVPAKQRPKTEVGSNKDRTIKLIEHHQKVMAPKLTPVDENSIEYEFKEVIGGVPMLGFVDLKIPTGIVDHKFVGKAKSVYEANDDLQLTLYSRVEGGTPMFNCLVKSKQLKSGNWSEPRTVLVPGKKRTQQQIDWFEQTLQYVAEAISSGTFIPANPTDWWCSDKFCGFWHMCRGAKKDKFPSIITMQETFKSKMAEENAKAIKKKAPEAPVVDTSKPLPVFETQ